MSMIPSYKDIIDLLKKGATIEAQEKIMELKEAVIELQEENQVLKSRVGELEKSLDRKKNLTWDPPYYWLKTGDASKDGPYCQRCYDKDEKLIRLQELETGLWDCKVCKITFTDKTYRAPEIVLTPRKRPLADW